MTSSEHHAGLSIRWQICLLTALIIFVSLVSLGLISFRFTRSTVIDLTMDKLLAQTRDAASSVEQMLEVTRADAINVPGFPPIPGIVRTLESGQDPDGSTTELWIQRLQQILESQMRTYSYRTACAVLSATGKELMRVEQAQGTRFVLTPEEELRNESQRVYFAEASKLRQNEVYVSSVNLDESGAPALYVASPYMDEGTLKAVFVIKLDGASLLESTNELITVGSIDIVDDRGMFIYSEDPANREFDPSVVYSQRFPECAARMQNDLRATGDEFSEYISAGKRPGAAVVGIYKKVRYNPNDPTRFLAIAPSIAADEALQPINDLAKQFLLVGITVLLVGVLVTSVASSGLTRAMRQLTRAADEIAAGQLDTELPKVKRYGEVGTLTASLATMTTNLRETISQVSAQEARTNAVLNATADALITINSNGIIQTFNTSAQQLFGYQPHEIIGKNVSILAPSPYREEHDHYLSRYHRSGEAHIIGKDRELEGQRKDGSKFPISLRVTELRHGEEQVFIGTVQDITTRKQAEQERQKVAFAVREAVSRLAASSHQILATTAEQSLGTQQQASAVTQSVATTEELAQTANQTVQRADAVSDAARRSKEVGEAGRDAVERSVTAMQEVKEQVESIAESILTLAERAQAIGEITATVRDIAEQINVLALNAAVEASRAGEHGKGFAVVASEVKSLAEQSKKATSQVRQILEEIQQATNNAVLSTEQGTRAVGAAEEVVHQAGDTIGTLSQTLADSARSAMQISASANQQAAGVVQLNQGMKSINKVTQQHAAAVKEIEKAAENLNELSNELASLTSLERAD